MIKIMAFLTKREDISTQAFIDYYETKHIPKIIMKNAPAPYAPISYKRSYLMRGDEIKPETKDARVDFDVVTELVFPDRAAYQAWGAKLAEDGGGEQIVEDESKFLVRKMTRAYVVEEHVTTSLSAT